MGAASERGEREEMICKRCKQLKENHSPWGHKFEPSEPVVSAGANDKLAEYIWNVRVNAIPMPRSKNDFIAKVNQDLKDIL